MIVRNSSKYPDQSSFMVSKTIESLLQKIGEIGNSYTQLILLVGPSGSGKTRILKTLQSVDQARFAYINVNLVLAEKLLNLSRFERQRDLQQILEDIVSRTKGEVLLLDNTEILFDASLQQDPIKCLSSISRRSIGIASWNGRYSNGRLTYAEPEHPEFKEYRIQEIDALVQPIGDETIV